MARLAAAPTLLLLAALLSGCASSTSTDAGNDAGAADPAAEAAASGVGGPSPEGRETTVREADWSAGLRAGPADYSFVGSGHPLERVSGENLTGVVVEMAWEASSPLSQEMTLEVARDDGGSLRPIAATSGASPLRLVFPGDEGKGDLILVGGPAGDPGTYVAQEYAFHLTTFHAIPFDPGYSALPA